MEEIVSGTGYQLNYEIKLATTENLRNAMVGGGLILHFSGHGMENS